MSEGKGREAIVREESDNLRTELEVREGSRVIKLKKTEKVAEQAAERKYLAQANSSKAITRSQSTIRQLKIHHRNEIKGIADKYAKEVCKIKRIADERHNEEIDMIKLSHAKDLDATNERYGGEIRRIAFSHTRDLDGLE